MDISLHSIAPQHANLRLILEPKDYEPQISQELKSLRKKANIKGFRPGTVPESMIKNLYGAAVRGEVLNKLINTAIEDYQKNADVHFLGDLLPVKDDGEPSLDQTEFVFEVGIAPKVDLQKHLGQLTVQRHKVNITESRIEEEVNYILERFAENAEVSEPVSETDLVELEAQELSNGLVKEDGIKSVFTVIVDSTLTPAFKDLLIGKEVNASFHGDITQVEHDMDAKGVRKYFLKLQDDDHREFENQFNFTIVKISRKVKPVFNKELYAKIFGPDTTVDSEESMRIHIKENLELYYESECNKIFEIDLIKNLHQEMALTFPDAFLKKWLVLSYEEWQKKDEHTLAHDLIHFKEGLAWQMVRKDIVEQNDIKVEYEDMIQAVIKQFKTMYGGINFPEESWRQVAQNALSKDKDKAQEYYLNVLNDKSIEWLKSNIIVLEDEITLDEFRDLVKKIQEHNHDHDHHHHESHDHHEHEHHHHEGDDHDHKHA